MGDRTTADLPTLTIPPCVTIFVHFSGSRSHDMTQLSHDFNFLLNFLQLIQVEHVKTFDIKVLNSFSIVLIHV